MVHIILKHSWNNYKFSRICVCNSDHSNCEEFTLTPSERRNYFSNSPSHEKILHGSASAYLNVELLVNYTTQRLLRSNRFNLLSFPRAKTAICGDRSSWVIAPKLWNDLLISIKHCFTVDCFI